MKPEPPLRGPESHRPRSGGCYKTLTVRGRIAVYLFSSGYSDLRPLSHEARTPAPRSGVRGPESHRPRSGGCYIPSGLILSGTVSRFTLFSPSDLQPLSHEASPPESHRPRSGGCYKTHVTVSDRIAVYPFPLRISGSSTPLRGPRSGVS